MKKKTEYDLFRFRLARELGKSLSEIDDMPRSEFLEWIEYYRIEPFATERMELMLAQLTALIYNKNTKKPKHQIDFLVSLDDETKAKIKQKQLEDIILKDLI